MENERNLNHGLGIGAAVGVAGWQELIVGLYVMQRHGVSTKAYMGRNVRGGLCKPKTQRATRHMADGGQFWSLQINANLRIVRTYHRFVIPLLWCFSWGETPPFRNKDQNQVL